LSLTVSTSLGRFPPCPVSFSTPGHHFVLLPLMPSQPASAD
jgi:hypothetical protein